MQETLAAGVVLAAGVAKGEHFVNPMCGSGTLAIEAALIMCGRAPGITRERFGFMHTLLYDESAWQKMCETARSRPDNLVGRIIASDNDPQVVAAARSNAAAAGVDHAIEFVTADFSETMVPQGRGVVVFNPEYGIRLGEEEQLVETYRAIGKFLKQQCQGYRGYIFTGNAKLAGNVGLKAGRRLRFLNGKIECKLYEYDLFRGKIG
jgi:putative N6-adenine-specific DNA methylase